MSIERTIIERLNESRRIDEAFPPILNNLATPSKKIVRDRLTRAGIDIENTPYELVTITDGRDPRLKGNGVVIFEIADKTMWNNVGVWFKNEFIVNPYVAKYDKNLSQMSWKTILEISKRIIVMEFNEESAAALKAKRAERATLQKDVVKRYDPKKDKLRGMRIDKSGYAIDPNRYKKMLADMKMKNVPALLQQAKEVYVKLANNIDKINWTEETNLSSFESYDYITKEIVYCFQNLNKRVAEYENYKKNHSTEDGEDPDSWIKYLQRYVQEEVMNLQNLMTKAKKYL